MDGFQWNSMGVFDPAELIREATVVHKFSRTWKTDEIESEDGNVCNNVLISLLIYIYYIIHDINIMQYYILYIQIYTGLYLHIFNSVWGWTSGAKDRMVYNQISGRSFFSHHFLHPFYLSDLESQLLLVRSPILVGCGCRFHVCLPDRAGRVQRSLLLHVGGEKIQVLSCNISDHITHMYLQ